MKTIGWLTFFFLLHFTVQAQTTISGVVKDSLNTPIPYAAVYLSKTTVGVLANDKGAYTLTIPQDGTYELIASCVGYKSHSQIISARGNTQKINIKLYMHIVLIGEVTVKAKDLNRRQNYDQFLKCFIGKTSNAKFCKIKNPKDLIVYRGTKDSVLKAYSTKSLEIVNSSLGYTIFYDLKYFRYNLKTMHLNFAGNYYFQEHQGNTRKNAKWQHNRLIAYYGSRMHFLRALVTDSVSQENFEMCDIELDSCGTKWVLTNSILANDLRNSFNPDSITLYHFNPVQIFYSDNHPELSPPYVLNWRKYTSVIVFSDSLQVYKNGYYPGWYNLSWGGYMAGDRIAELLPYDFEPKLAEKDIKKE